MEFFSTIHRKQAAFTILELIVAITIIVTISAFLIPTISGVREKAKRVQCVNNLRQIGIAIPLYAQDNVNRALPSPSPVVSNQDPNFTSYCMRRLSSYLMDQGTLFYCPSDLQTRPTKRLQNLVHANNSYCYVSTLTLNAPLCVPVLFDKGVGAFNPAWANNTALLYTFDNAVWATTNPNYLSNHGTGGGNMLFISGKIEFRSTFPVYFSDDPNYDFFDPGTDTVVNRPTKVDIQERFRNVVRN